MQFKLFKEMRSGLSWCFVLLIDGADPSTSVSILLPGAAGGVQTWIIELSSGGRLVERKSVPSSTYQVLFSGLMPATEYSYTVRSQNGAISLPASFVITAGIYVYGVFFVIVLLLSCFEKVSVHLLQITNSFRNSRSLSFASIPITSSTGEPQLFELRLSRIPIF